jgi:amino acid permease
LETFIKGMLFGVPMNFFATRAAALELWATWFGKGRRSTDESGDIELAENPQGSQGSSSRYSRGRGSAQNDGNVDNSNGNNNTSNDNTNNTNNSNNSPSFFARFLSTVLLLASGIIVAKILPSATIFLNLCGASCGVLVMIIFPAFIGQQLLCEERRAMRSVVGFLYGYSVVGMVSFVATVWYTIFPVE